MFPEREEKQLRLIFSRSTKHFMEELEMILGKEKLTKEDEERFKKALKGYEKKLTSELVKSLTTFQGVVFKEWSNYYSKLEMVEITKHKSWIDTNINIQKDTLKRSLKKLKNIRDERKEEYLGKLSEQFEFRINKKKLSKMDVKYINNYLKNKGWKKDIPNLDKYTKSDLVKIRDHVRMRNKFWARDQAGNIYSADLEALALKNNIKSFIWRTENDKRVRDTHAIRNGRTFDFKTTKILPGEETLCRCWGDPTVKKRVTKIKK